MVNSFEKNVAVSRNVLRMIGFIWFSLFIILLYTQKGARAVSPFLRKYVAKEGSPFFPLLIMWHYQPARLLRTPQQTRELEQQGFTIYSARLNYVIIRCKWNYPR